MRFPRQAWKPQLVPRQHPLAPASFADSLGGRPKILSRRVRGWHRKRERHIIMRVFPPELRQTSIAISETRYSF
eukprot:2930559-Pyramimonas_sp.AAC.1